MTTTVNLECTDKIIDDFEYAKLFKTPSVLFTKSGQVIGLGELFSYIKIEVSDYKSYLRNIILDTRNFTKVINAIDKVDTNKQVFYTRSNPTILSTTVDNIELGIGLSPEYVTYGVFNILQDIQYNCNQVYSKKLSSKDDFLLKLRTLHADEGAIPYTIKTDNYGNWIIMITKKILPIVISDKVTVNFLVHCSNPNWGYIEIVTETTKGFTYMTYLKILKV